MIPQMSKQGKWEIHREIKMTGEFMEKCSALLELQKCNLKKVTYYLTKIM